MEKAKEIIKEKKKKQKGKKKKVNCSRNFWCQLKSTRPTEWRWVPLSLSPARHSLLFSFLFDWNLNLNLNLISFSVVVVVERFLSWSRGLLLVFIFVYLSNFFFLGVFFTIRCLAVLLAPFLEVSVVLSLRVVDIFVGILVGILLGFLKEVDRGFECRLRLVAVVWYHSVYGLSITEILYGFFWIVEIFVGILIGILDGILEGGGRGFFSVNWDLLQCFGATRFMAFLLPRSCMDSFGFSSAPIECHVLHRPPHFSGVRVTSGSRWPCPSVSQCTLLSTNCSLRRLGRRSSNSRRKHLTRRRRRRRRRRKSVSFFDFRDSSRILLRVFNGFFEVFGRDRDTQSLWQREQHIGTEMCQVLTHSTLSVKVPDDPRDAVGGSRNSLQGNWIGCEDPTPLRSF